MHTLVFFFKHVRLHFCAFMSWNIPVLKLVDNSSYSLVSFPCSLTTAQNEGVVEQFLAVTPNAGKEAMLSLRWQDKTETRDYLNSGDGIPFPLWNSIQKRESNVQFHLKWIVNFSFLLVLKEFTKSKRELANFLLGFKLCALGITWLYKLILCRMFA